MLILENHKLSISLIDPNSDDSRSGSRYCHGGYIWQIEDSQLGPILSGPNYPENPTAFDGQGMPEVFESALGYFPTYNNDQVMVIGVGTVLRTSDKEPFHTRWNSEIIKPCTWNIKTDQNSIQMTTEHSLKGYAYSLIRKISLSNRSIESYTEVKNLGTIPISFRWFPHPFFPLNPDYSCLKLSASVTIPENPGFYLNDQNYMCMKKNYDWTIGFYRTLETNWHEPLNALIKHPLINDIRIVCKYTPAWLPVWANNHTFSIEPLISAFITPGNHKNWSICYHF